MTQGIVHYGLHLLAPLIVSYLFFYKNWKRGYLIMLATMIVDLDHLLSYPAVFVPDRCSIGFHPLHSYSAIVIYLILLFPQKTRIIALGLLLHMATDYQDCWWF